MAGSVLYASRGTLQRLLHPHELGIKGVTLVISELTKPYHATVMALNAWRPMDKRERRSDYAYAAFLVTTIILIPLSAYPIALLMGHDSALWAFGILLVFAGIGISGGLLRRRYILSRFFGVMDVEGRMELCPVRGREHFERLAEVPMLAFPRGMEASTRLFVYNWLRNRQALSGQERILAYVMPGEQLLAYLGSDAVADTSLLLIPESELELPVEAPQRNRFERELFMIRGERLAQLVTAVRNETQERQAAEAAARAAETADEPIATGPDDLANKGQSLR